jgi:hypothetical protein
MRTHSSGYSQHCKYCKQKENKRTHSSWVSQCCKYNKYCEQWSSQRQKKGGGAGREIPITSSPSKIGVVKWVKSV